jgi:hypothetical protein
MERFDVSDNGRLVYESGSASNAVLLNWFDRSGNCRNHRDVG